MEMKLLSHLGTKPIFDPIPNILPKQGAHPGIGESQSKEKPTFFEFLQKNLKGVNEAGLEADREMQKTVEGTQSNPHATMIALQKADISFRLMMTVKDQLIQAYQHLVRTPIG